MVFPILSVPQTMFEKYGFEAAYIQVSAAARSAFCMCCMQVVLLVRLVCFCCLFLPSHSASRLCRSGASSADALLIRGAHWPRFGQR